MTRAERSERLKRARLQLLFTPELCGERDPLAVLEATLPWVDVIQVRIKQPGGAGGPAPAREVFEWTQRVLDLLDRPDAGDAAPLVIVNDRVDVCACLERRGVAGVHLGAEDTPPEVARSVLGEHSVIGVSTHSARDIVRLSELSAVDYLGFGPIHPTETKGYERGLGAEAAWIAQSATHLPIFPIGGISGTNAGELSRVGRAAVSSAILGATDPGTAARELYEELSPEAPVP